MKIELSEIALKELAAIKSYIASDSKHYAKLFIEKLLNSIKKLKNLPIPPEIGKIRDFFPEKCGTMDYKPSARKVKPVGQPHPNSNKHPIGFNIDK